MNITESEARAACPKRTFTRIEYDGSFCIMEPHEANGVLRDSAHGPEYKVSAVYMTQAEFDALPDFAGF